MNQTTTNLQLRDRLPPLTPDEYERLKASIAERGYVGEPTIVDQDNNTVHGFHRQRACDEPTLPEVTVQPPISSGRLDQESHSNISGTLDGSVAGERHFTRLSERRTVNSYT